MENDSDKRWDFEALAHCGCGDNDKTIALGDHNTNESQRALEYTASATSTAYPVRLDLLMEQVSDYRQAFSRTQAFEEAIARWNVRAELRSIVQQQTPEDPKVRAKCKQSFPTEVCNPIPKLVFDHLCGPKFVNHPFASKWHHMLHCVLDSCQPDNHIWMGGFGAEQAYVYAKENHRNHGDYGSDSEREEDGDGYDDTPEGSWWEVDHEKTWVIKLNG